MNAWDWAFIIMASALLPFAAMGVAYTLGLIRREGFRGTNRLALPAALCGLLACAGCLLLPFLPSSGFTALLLRSCRALTAFLFLLYGGFCLYAAAAFHRKGPWVTILVLGCGGKDGFASRNELAGRAALAASLWRPGKTLVASGGGEGRPESSVIAEQLRAAGVPAPAIREENRSRDTLENLKACRELAEPPCLIVTSRYHLPRALLLGCLAGFRGLTGAGSQSVPFLYASFYEMLACLYFFPWLPIGFFVIFLLKKLFLGIDKLIS